MKIKELTYIQYIFNLNKSWHTALANYYMKSVLSGRGKAYVLYDEDIIVSYAICVKYGSQMVCEYLYTGEEYRNKGYATELLGQIIETEKNTRYWSIHITSSNPHFESVLKCANKNGFKNANTSYVYSVETGETLWNRMDELNVFSMKARILRKNTECIPLNIISEDIYNQILNSNSTEFKNSLEPNRIAQISESESALDMSYALISNGKMRAYTLLSRIRDDVVYIEQIAESYNEIGSGNIIAPLCASIEDVRNNENIKQIKFTILEKNYRSKRFVMKLVKGIEIKSVMNILMSLNT